DAASANNAPKAHTTHRIFASPFPIAGELTTEPQGMQDRCNEAPREGRPFGLRASCFEENALSAAHSLPAWLYFDPHFFELEREKIFRSAWQLVGHLNDAPNPGDYITLSILGERVVALRGADGVLRSFHNVCRHRAAKVAPEDRGSCGHRLVCPYHAWSYNLDGTLAGAPK